LASIKAAKSLLLEEQFFKSGSDLLSYLGTTISKQRLRGLIPQAVACTQESPVEEEESRLRSRRRAVLAASFHRQNDREDGQGEERQEEAQAEAQERLPAKASS
jgi:hypothetical protein